MKENSLLTNFTDPSFVARYTEGPPRFKPCTE